MAYITDWNPKHKYDTVWGPCVTEHVGSDGKTFMGTHVSIPDITITCGDCGNIHKSNSNCPFCNSPIFLTTRKLTDEEIELAAVIGLDPADVANWDQIERVAKKARHLYGDDYYDDDDCDNVNDTPPPNMTADGVFA